MTLSVGDNAPDFNHVCEDGKEISLTELKGKKVVLYFYPKDDTPGCTIEACAFRDNMNRLTAVGVAVIGVSKDSEKSHRNFKDKYGLNFPLIADTDTTLCQAYGVWKEKKNYGKTYMGIQRSTFLIDEKGKIAYIWDNVKVDGHVDEILSKLS